MWRDNTVRVLRTSNLEEMARERLGDTVARSVLFAQFDTADAEAAAPTATSSYLLCGLGDGNLISFEVQSAGGVLTGRRKVAIGTSGQRQSTRAQPANPLRCPPSIPCPSLLAMFHARALCDQALSFAVS